MSIYLSAKCCEYSGMDIYAIRKKNLLHLLKTRERKDCVARWNTSTSTISQIVSAKANRNLGDLLARKIELAEGLERGWMDRRHDFDDDGSSNVEGEPFELKGGVVPVKGAAQLGPGGYFEALNYPVEQGDGYLKILSQDVDAYGLKVVGNSMMPRIKHHEFVVVEPNHGYVAGDEVLVCTHEGQCMIKIFMWLREGQYRFDSINDDYAPVYLMEDEVESIHYVGAIVKPSRHMP